MSFRNFLPIILLCTLFGCRMGATLAQRSLVADLEASDGELNLASIGPQNWDRMCVLTPYTSNQDAESTLGFPWDADGRTGIERRDDIYVVVFINDDQVSMYLEMPRHEAELLHAETPCFEFSDEIIYRNEMGIWMRQQN